MKVDLLEVPPNQMFRKSKDSSHFSRRGFLASSVAIGSIGIAGCSEDSPGTPTPTPDPTPAETPQNDPPEEDPDFEIEVVADGFSHPWGMEFLPDGHLVLTERSGDLLILNRESGEYEPVSGLPDVHVAGQGGLLDVALHPLYPDEAWIYLTYSAANDGGDTATHLARGELDVDSAALDGVETLHIAEPFDSSNFHYGSRVAFGDDEMVYMTTGDRQRKDFGPEHVSQDVTNTWGATLRFEPDGSVPEDNPFLDDDDAADEIYSYGHRNAQGMTVHPETGDLWQSEHGEQDGDEINIIEAGGNYGWPITHYGCTYDSGEPVGDLPHERDDVVDPLYYWECNSGGFPPAGMTFYSGDAFPAWEGDLFIGNLAGHYLGHFTVDGSTVEEREPLLEDEGWRIRDVAVAPETSHLYVLVDAEDAPVVRLVPT